MIYETFHRSFSQTTGNVPLQYHRLEPCDELRTKFDLAFAPGI